MDGASEWRVFSGVVLPLGIPAIASLLIFQFLWVWNDLLVALVFAGGDTQPLTVAIREQLRSFSANIDVIAPAAFLQMVVPAASCSSRSSATSCRVCWRGRSAERTFPEARPSGRG